MLRRRAKDLEVGRRAFVMDGFGATKNAYLPEMPVPVAGPDELMVRMAVAGVNPVDYKEVQGFLTGYYPETVDQWIIGHDGAGIVKSVGPNVTGFAPGDRVMFLPNRQSGRQSGTFAAYALVDCRFAAPAPDSMSLLEASTIPVAAATSHQGLFREDVGKALTGQPVLIHGADGGLGSFAVSMCRNADLQIRPTCRAANASHLRALGAHCGIDYQPENVAAATWAESKVTGREQQMGTIAEAPRVEYVETEIKYLYDAPVQNPRRWLKYWTYDKTRSKLRLDRCGAGWFRRAVARLDRGECDCRSRGRQPSWGGLRSGVAGVRPAPPVTPARPLPVQTRHPPWRTAVVARPSGLALRQLLPRLTADCPSASSARGRRIARQAHRDHLRNRP